LIKPRCSYVAAIALALAQVRWRAVPTPEGHLHQQIRVQVNLVNLFVAARQRNQEIITRSSKPISRSPRTTEQKLNSFSREINLPIL
jgi:hypothetical protein